MVFRISHPVQLKLEIERPLLYMVFAIEKQNSLELYPLIRERFSLLQPRSHIGLRNYINLSSLGGTCGAAVVVFAQVRSIIRHHIHGNYVGDKVDFDVIVISPCTLRTGLIVHMPVDDRTLPELNRIKFRSKGIRIRNHPSLV